MLDFFSPYTKIIEAVVLAVVLWFGYNYIGDKAVDKYKTAQAVLQAKVDNEQRAKLEAVTKELEATKLMRAGNDKVIYKETTRVVQAAPIVYAASCWDDAGLLNANAAISGRNLIKSQTEMPANPAN